MPRTSRKALRETGKRTLWKLVIVSIAFVAFFMLRWMENKKSDFEKERANPIVIVEQNVPTQGPENVIKLSRPGISVQLETILSPSETDLNALREKSDRNQTDSVLVESLTKFREAIRKSIPNARRVPFESEDKFVAYLSEHVDKAKKEAEDHLTAADKKRRAAIENLRKTFANKPDEFKSNLKNQSDTDFSAEFDKPRPGQTETASGDAGPQPDSRSTDALASAANTIEDRRIAAYREKIGESAYYTKDNLYSGFVPGFLKGHVREQKRLGPHPNTFSEMVLDKQRGGHVIYQIFYLAFIGVLVFGILFPIYLALSALPPFAGSVEPLTARAKDLLSRPGAASSIAAPEVMKTIALSMSVIGIGAAVVIANNPVTGNDPGNGEVAVIADSPYNPPKLPPGPSTPSVPPTGGPSPQISPTPSEGGPTPTPAPTINLYPSFYPTFTVDNARLGQLERDFGKTQQTVDDIANNRLPLKAEKTELSGLVTRKDLDPISKEVERLPALEKKLDGQIETLNKTIIPGLRDEIAVKHSELTDRLNVTNNAITGFREGTQGRSFFSRARELFARERYQVTRGSYDVIHQLMCSNAACRAGTTEDQIVRTLQSLIDKPSMDKKSFQKKLGIGAGRAIPSTRWEPLILRYNRVPY